MNNRSVHIIVAGLVQGVYFRASAAEAAMRYGVTGWCRNTIDGSVEIVAEGTQGAVEEFILWCRTGSEAARVDRVDATEQEHSGSFTNFKVRA